MMRNMISHSAAGLATQGIQAAYTAANALLHSSLQWQYQHWHMQLPTAGSYAAGPCPAHFSSQSHEPSSMASSSSMDASKQGSSRPTFSVSPHITDANSKEPLKSADYASSFDDKYGVQKNWFTALYRQLNYIAKSNQVPTLKGRQREVFEQVEKEFEVLYNKYIKDKSRDEEAHRSTLMVCLSVATFRVLNDEFGDTKMVRDMIKINLGDVMIKILKPLHSSKLWVMSKLLREDMYAQAVNLLPAVTKDMGQLCTTETTTGEQETILKVSKCCYYDILHQEDVPFLLTEFCCHHSLIWLHEFRKYGVSVTMDKCLAWDDDSCSLRIASQPRGSS